MTFEEWEAKYKPVQNHINTNASLNGCMFETYGSKLAFVVNTYEETPEIVWTWVDDGEHSTLTNGFQFVNRMGYFITEKPYGLTEGFINIDLND